MRFNALALSACLAGIGCPRPTEPEPEPPSVASDGAVAPEPTPTPTASEPPRPFEITYFVDRQLWRIDPDGNDARSLGYEVPSDGYVGSSRVGSGGHDPTISRDGRWLACLTGTNLLVVELADDGPRVTPVTKLPPAKDNWLVAADVGFSEWSPDSSTLIVILDEPGYEEADPLPLPPDYHYGYYVLRTDGLALEFAPHIEGYLGWNPDSKAVVDDKYIAAKDYQLLAYPLAPGSPTIFHRSNDPYGHSQLDVVTEHFAWTASGDGSTSQIVVMPIAGGDIVPLSPKGKFADIQWPRLSPNGKQAVFKQKANTMLGDSDGPPSAWPNPPEFQWWDDEHVVTMTDAGLVMADLQGQVRVLDPAATGLVHH